MIFLNNVSAQYKQYSIYNLNSENNVLFIHIVLQINSSVSGEEGSQLPKSLVLGQTQTSIGDILSFHSSPNPPPRLRKLEVKTKSTNVLLHLV